MHPYLGLSEYYIISCLNAMHGRESSEESIATGISFETLHQSGEWDISFYFISPKRRLEFWLS